MRQNTIETVEEKINFYFLKQSVFSFVMNEGVTERLVGF